MRYIVADAQIADLLVHQRPAFLEADAAVAIGSFVAALVLAAIVDRALRRAQAARIVSDRLDAGADTRLRFLRRVIETAIIVVGIAIALSQFTALDRVAASVLASSVIAAAVVGFAARQTLANVVAGILLAITQPLRLGDVVTLEGNTGTVEDVRLTYTYLRTASGMRVVIPNERLAASILHNETVLGLVTPEASIWIAYDTDVDAAITAIEAGDDVAAVTVAESVAEGIRLTITGTASSPDKRAAREAELRRGALRVVAGVRERASAG